MTRKAFSILALAALVTAIVMALSPLQPEKGQKNISCKKNCEKKDNPPADNMMIDNISRQFIVFTIPY